MTAPTVRLGTPEDIGAAVPSLVGFVPGAGDVVLVTRAGRRLGLTARMDAPEDGHEDDLAVRLVAALPSDVTAATLVCWEGPVGGPAYRLAFALQRAGLAVDTLVTVQGDRACVECVEAGCGCSLAEWRPMPADRVRPVAIVEAGAVVAPSRDAVVARFAVDPASSPDGFARAMGRSLADVAQRDVYLAALGTADPSVLPYRLDALAACARSYPAGDDARNGALCCAAVAAWLLGDGGSANVALEAVTPGYALGGLLRAALGFGMSPAALRGLLRKP